MTRTATPLFIVLCLTLGASCQHPRAPEPHVSPSSARIVSSAACSTSIEISRLSLLQALVLSSVPGLSFNDRQASKLRLDSIKRLSGPCLAQLEDAHPYGTPTAYVYKFGNIYLRDETGTLVTSFNSPTASFTDRLGPSDRHPIWTGEFLTASQVNGDPDSKAGEYVGLWRQGSTWSVAAFSCSDSSCTPPQELMTSSVPVLTVTYGNPAPDANIGTISLIQQVPNALRLVAVDWDHSGAFRSKGSP